MIHIKKTEEIKNITKSCDILSQMYGYLARYIKPGVNLLDLDNMAERFIIDHGGKPACKNYNGFPKTLCISINEEVVHGIPNNRILNEGDIVSLDSGVIFNGYYSDSAYTFGVGNIDNKLQNLLDVTKQALLIGIQQAINGNRVGNISFAIDEFVRKNKYKTIVEYTGHGVGKFFHEEPAVPNQGKKNNGPKLIKNMTIAIEPMVSMGSEHVLVQNNGWTAVTVDFSPSAHYEHTVLITDDEPQILTTFKYIEENL